MNVLRSSLFAAMAMAMVVLAVLPGCGRDIGDECQTSVDCDPSGQRACDLSQPGGYCTIQGCNETSCPEDSICVRFFPQQYLSKPCVAACEDSHCALGPCPAQDMCADQCDQVLCPQGPTHDCDDDEVCLTSGVCARRIEEQRACAKTCDGNGDCRGGYVCRSTGTPGGGMLLSRMSGGDSLSEPVARFCAPDVR